MPGVEILPEERAVGDNAAYGGSRKSREISSCFEEQLGKTSTATCSRMSSDSDVVAATQCKLPNEISHRRTGQDEG